MYIQQTFFFTLFLLHFTERYAHSIFAAGRAKFPYNNKNNNNNNNNNNNKKELGLIRVKENEILKLQPRTLVSLAKTSVLQLSY